MTLVMAKLLVRDAVAFTTGEMQYMSEDHPIRRQAQASFGQSHGSHLRAICADICCLIAADYMQQGMADR